MISQHYNTRYNTVISETSAYMAQHNQCTRRRNTNMVWTFSFVAVLELTERV